LAQFFYNPVSAGRPVYLQVDSDTLRDVGSYAEVEPDQAEASFIGAVCSKLRTEKRNPFVEFLRARRYWRRQLRENPTMPPPFLGLLGACVLAASRMCSDPDRGVRGSNYYVRLNELLGLSLHQVPEEVTRFWTDLNEWLERNEGELGLPTARSHPWFRHIGYPLSQCLLRNTDRQKLPDFFHWEGLSPGEDVSSEELVPRLKLWATRTTCTFSEHGRAILSSGDDRLIRQAAEMVVAELKLWDGGSIDTEGRRSARIELRLEVRRGGRLFKCELCPQAPDGFPEGLYQAESVSVDLARLPGANWFEPLLDELLEETLLSGLVIRKDQYALQFRPTPVIPLREHIELGGWVSCGRVNMSERHIVLCGGDHRERIEDYLTKHAESGWEQAPGSQGLPSGWICFRNVRIVALANEYAEELDCLVPRLRVGIQLVSGLKVEHDVWLKGGEPEALITMQESRQVTVYIDSQEFKSLPEGTGVLQLADLDLAPGQHEIVAGTQRRSFHLCLSGYCPTRPSEREALGHMICRDEAGLYPTSLGPASVPQLDVQESGKLFIVGARVFGSPRDVEVPTQEVLLLPCGYRHYVVLGRLPGEVAEYCFESEWPYWFLRKSGCLEGNYEVAIPFEPQWLITIGPKRRKTLSPIGIPGPPETMIADDDKVAAWARWARKRYHNRKGRQDALDLWEEYREVAIGLSGKAS
jgi:hypothetical protein